MERLEIKLHFALGFFALALFAAIVRRSGRNAKTKRLQEELSEVNRPSIEKEKKL